MLRMISLLLALVAGNHRRRNSGTLLYTGGVEPQRCQVLLTAVGAAGWRLEVTITATNYGGFGQVEETLPEGFTYTGSSLSEGSVTVDGQTVSFVLLGDTSFTYTVEVPDVEGIYAFSGVLKDANREERVIGGASQVIVGPEPTATPTPEPTATPTPTLEPTEHGNP